MSRANSPYNNFIFSKKADEDDRRLVSAGIPVFLFFSFIFATAYSESLGFLRNEAYAAESERLKMEQNEDRLYHVLVEQEYSPEAKTDQMRALSDVTAEGTGGITKSYGFHTLTEYDTLSMSGSGQGGNQASEQSRNTPQNNEEGSEERTAASAANQGRPGNPGNQGLSGEEQEMKIPANYRFRHDFSLRYDESPQMSVARQELAGYKYFRDMLRRIRETFSPPGYNIAYRDRAGTVISQPIKPQVVEVLFMLDTKGNVRDVRVVSSMGQRPVDQACINSLAGQNFGPPPPEVLAKGNIFGINFIFPAIFN